MMTVESAAFAADMPDAPRAVARYSAGIALTIVWVAFGLPVGPGASVAHYLL